MTSAQQQCGVCRHRGFTLVETMMVLLVVSILVGIAVPAYQNSLNKGRRSDARSALMDVANRQESLMLDRNTYTEDMTQLGFAADPMVSSEKYYTVDAQDCGDGIDRCYVLTATPRPSGAQAGDTRCTTLVVDSNGARTATGSAIMECW